MKPISHKEYESILKLSDLKLTRRLDWWHRVGCLTLETIDGEIIYTVAVTIGRRMDELKRLRLELVEANKTVLRLV